MHKMAQNDLHRIKLPELSHVKWAVKHAPSARQPHMWQSCHTPPKGRDKRVLMTRNAQRVLCARCQTSL
jgi:hypothetical protein